MAMSWDDWDIELMLDAAAIALILVVLVVGAEALAGAWQRREVARGTKRRRPKAPRKRGKAAYR